MCWTPFVICEAGKLPPRTRPIETHEGIGDRLRAAAFAEMQAARAFAWAARHFTHAPEELREAWLRLVKEEEKHLGWLLTRMEKIGAKVGERPVSLRLWDSFMVCKTAEQFALFMASAEDRGRVAGERFYATLISIDPITAEIFRKIAFEERSHIELASWANNNVNITLTNN